MDDTSSYSKKNFNNNIKDYDISSQSTTIFTPNFDQTKRKITYNSLLPTNPDNKDWCMKEEDYYYYVINSIRLVISISSLFNLDIYQHQLSTVKNKTKELLFMENSSILCFDLDETLIYSKEVKEISLINNYDFVIKSNEQFIVGWIRPGAKELLLFCKEINLNLCIFSSADKEYIESILDYVNFSVYFDYVLCREYCIKINHNLYIKDLSIFNTSSDNVMIIENSLISFSPFLQNGILVNSFIGDKKDYELFEIVEHLKIIQYQGKLSTTKNERYFRFNEIKNEVEKDFKK